MIKLQLGKYLPASVLWAGICFWRKKFMRKRFFAYAMLYVLLATVALSGCQINLPPWKKLAGRGEIITLENSLSGDKYSLVITDIQFTASNTGAIEIDEDLSDKFTLSTYQNIADTITVTVDDEVGTIHLKGNKKYRYSTDDFKIQVGVPLGSVEIDGGFTLDLKLPSVTDFTLKINGAISGDLAFDQLDTLTVQINGASNIALTGDCEQCTVSINGASDIDAADFRTQDSAITINGAGSYTVNATGTLDAYVNGVGTITYIGEPG
ncbi:MAG TPA: hypothetical protein DDY38_08645, partial [Firmicutes bacterium]|nr:hypothetical protein [Bacillota bacterium]